MVKISDNILLNNYSLPIDLPLGRLFICRILEPKMFSEVGEGVPTIHFGEGSFTGGPFAFGMTVYYSVSQDLCTCNCSLSN